MNHKYLNYLAIIPVLTLIFLFYTNPISAQTGIPPGSYKKTCKDIQIIATKLWAVCEKADGSYEKSTLNYQHCEGDISNNNGRLSCRQKAGKQPPNGSYKNSCKNIRVDGKQLKAKCEKKNGKWNNTSIKYKNCNKDIKNDNGNLTCGGGNSTKFPKGSYKKSCKNLQKEGKWLEADCKNKNGKWKHSSIKFKNCKNGIYNDNGKLRCN